MKLMLDERHVIQFIADDIRWGIYDEPVEKWGLYDSEGRLMVCVINHSGLTVTDEITITSPPDLAPYKYKYEGGRFVRNPDWHEPLPPVEERIADIELMMADILYEISLSQIGLV